MAAKNRFVVAEIPDLRLGILSASADAPGRLEKARQAAAFAECGAEREIRRDHHLSSQIMRRAWMSATGLFPSFAGV